MSKKRQLGLKLCETQFLKPRLSKCRKVSKSDERKVSKSVKKCQKVSRKRQRSVKKASTRPQIARDPASNCARPNFSNRDFRSVEKCRKVSKSVKKCQKVSKSVKKCQKSVNSASTRPQIVRDPASNCTRPNFSNRDFRSVEKCRKVTKSVKKCQKVSKSVKKASKKRQKSVNSASNCARPGLMCETQFLKQRLSRCRKVSKNGEKCQKVSKSVKKCQKVSRKRLRSVKEASTRPQIARDPASNCARPNFSNRDFRSVEKCRKVTKSVKKCQKLSKSVKKASKKRQKSVKEASKKRQLGLKLCETRPQTVRDPISQTETFEVSKSVEK